MVAKIMQGIQGIQVPLWAPAVVAPAGSVLGAFSPSVPTPASVNTFPQQAMGQPAPSMMPAASTTPR